MSSKLTSIRQLFRMFAFVAIPVWCKLCPFSVRDFLSNRPRTLSATSVPAHPTALCSSSNQGPGRSRIGREDPALCRQSAPPCRCRSTLKCTRAIYQIAAAGKFQRSTRRSPAQCRDHLKGGRMWITLCNYQALPSTMMTKS